MLLRPAFAAALCTLALAGCHQAENLAKDEVAANQVECPTPQLKSADGLIEETPADIQIYQQRFADGFSEDALTQAIGALKAKYPDAGNDAITNYLVGAYCPDAVQQAVGRGAQQAKINQFEASVHAILGD